MFEAYEYVAEHGITLKQDYAAYHGHQSSCDADRVAQKWHFKNLGQ